ncbi:hypothetical protein JCM3774_003420 [Rhodotorula dairenensis]
MKEHEGLYEPANATSSWDVSSLHEALNAHPPPPPVSPLSTVLIRALPILATISWLGTLTALLVGWAVEGQKVLSDESGAVPYVSELGYRYRDLFVTGSCATAIFFVASLATERALRATRVLPEVTTDRKIWYLVGFADILAGAAAGLALCGLLTAIFCHIFAQYGLTHDEKNRQICFIVFLFMSGLLQTIEVSHLWHEHPDRHSLRNGCLLKWLVLGVSLPAGITFIVLHLSCSGDAFAEPVETCYRVITAAVIFQWVTCFGCGAYFSTLMIDLWPVHRHAVRALPRVKADSNGSIYGIWLPSTQNTQAYEYRPIPPHLELQRFPPAQAPDDATTCGVRLVPRTTFPTSSGREGPASRSMWSHKEWYETGKRGPPGPERRGHLRD